MSKRLRRYWALVGALLIAACAHQGVTPRPRPGGDEEGLASWYGEPYHGRQTASGEIYDMHALTAAHRTLPFASLVRVTRRDTGASVEVRINDRGPFIRGRIIDLSYAAACRIGLDIDGVVPVVVEVLGTETRPRPPLPVQPGGPECWWIQVGAFSEEGNAQRVREQLVDAGERVVLMEGPGGLHRIRLGPFKSEAKARDTLDRVHPTWPSSQLVECGK